MVWRYVRHMFWLAFVHWERVQAISALFVTGVTGGVFVAVGPQSLERLVTGVATGLLLYFVLSLLLIAPYQAWAASEKRLGEFDKEPVLKVNGPYTRLAEVDTQQLPLWYMQVENIQPRSIARNVRVRMDDPAPQIIMSFPIDLHRMHDNVKPFTKVHDIRYGEPVTFDLLACGQIDPEMYYLYRADGDESSQVGPEWMLSSDDNSIISSAIREPEGWRFDVVATPDPPALSARAHFCLKMDGETNLPSLERRN